MSDSIRDLIADVLKKHSIATRPYTDPIEKIEDADAILAHPSVIEILDLAKWCVRPDRDLPMWSVETDNLLDRWRQP